MQKKEPKKENFFLDKFIWRCWNKLPQLRTEYLLSAVNGLRISLMILHVTQRDFSTWTAFTGINKYRKSAVVQISTDFRPVYDVTCRRVLWNDTF